MTRLEFERRRRGLSKAALARAAGLHPSTIGVIERHEMKMWPSWARKLSQALGIAESCLLEEVNLDGKPVRASG
jgi:ribosome-binding protein aMBF1 (putative translation factor)